MNESRKKTYRAKYNVEFFQRKKIESYALWSVYIKTSAGRYGKTPVAYGKTQDLESANIALTNWCIKNNLTFDDLTQDSLIPWRLIKDLLDGKDPAEFFARNIKKRVTKNQVIEQAIPKNELVHWLEGKVYTSSLVVADKFKKKHKNVLQAIEKLPQDEFTRLNFQPSSYLNEQNKSQLIYEITWKGFSMLAMGFTGIAAYQWKQSFLDAFESMGDYIFRHKQLAFDTSMLAEIEKAPEEARVLFLPDRGFEI